MHIMEDVRRMHPGTLFGTLHLSGLDSGEDRQSWTRLRDEETAAFRQANRDYERKSAQAIPPLSCYAAYYKKFRKTYPVLLQMESVLLQGKDVRSPCLAVEIMFLAEVKHGILVAGHDADLLAGQNVLDVAQGFEKMTTISGIQRSLKAGDLFLANEERILSTILEGQDFTTRLTPYSGSALYCAYGVGGIQPAMMEAFFNDLKHYAAVAFPRSSTVEERIYE